MLLCPSCSEVLKKDPRHGEGVWQCPNCKEEWFIINIPKPAHLLKSKKKKK